MVFPFDGAFAPSNGTYCRLRLVKPFSWSPLSLFRAPRFNAPRLALPFYIVTILNRDRSSPYFCLGGPTTSPLKLFSLADVSGSTKYSKSIPLFLPSPARCAPLLLPPLRFLRAVTLPHGRPASSKPGRLLCPLCDRLSFPAVVVVGINHCQGRHKGFLPTTTASFYI